MAIVFTANPETVSAAKLPFSVSAPFMPITPGMVLGPVRKLPVSKAPPRSMKKGSSTVPAKTETPRLVWS